MNDQSFILKVYIIRSLDDNYIENKYKKIKIIKKIGEGSYGLVFLLNNDHVIKIFKNSTFKNTILDESNYLIPIKNENRELIFYYKYIDEKKENNYIINLYSIGIIKDIIIDNTNNIELNSYFIILPLCTSFYNIFKIFNTELIDKKNGIIFTIKIMKRIVQISEFLESKYNIINLDLKLNNFMFANKSKNLDNLIMLDFSIIKKKTKIKYKIDNKYYIWPESNNILIEYLPSYSTCINGLELLFGHKSIINIRNNNKLEYYLRILEIKDKNVYNIFLNGLILKINTKNFLKLLNLLII
jgi:serine/threonine protein kinase